MIKSVMCSERLPAEAIEKLRSIAERVFLLPFDKKLSTPVCHHPDMILTVIGDRLICHRDYYEEHQAFLKDMCTFSGLTPVLSEIKRGSKYPEDIAFNSLVTDKYIYCNIKHTAKEVLSCVADLGFEAVNVAQGYAACSCLLIDGTVITSDTSITKAVAGKNEVLHTQGGGILLEPYDTGFIGGAGAYYGGTLYTFGDLTSYNGAEAVLDFVSKHKITVCQLLEGSLCDYGGIKFIK